MSQTREEPANRSVDFILSDGRAPTPLPLKARLSGEGRPVYPLSERAVRIRDAGGRALFDGSLAAFDLCAAFAGRVTVRCADPATFLAEAVERDGKLYGTRYEN